MSKAPTFRISSRSPNRTHRKFSIEVENKELIKECRRLKDMLENPRVTTEQHRQMGEYMYKNLKQKFQKEYEEKVGTLYPSQIGYREKYMSLKQDYEQLRKELEYKNEVIEKLKSDKNELTNVKEQNDQLSLIIHTHICPKFLSEFSEPRSVPSLMAALWGVVLKDNPSGFRYHYKKSLAEIMTEGNCDYCTHISISTGFKKSGLYVSHSEAIAIVSEISKLKSDPEDIQISASAFTQLIDKYQPYRLWEDVLDILLYLRVRFSCHNITPSYVRTSILCTNRNLSKQAIGKKLSGKTFKIKRNADLLSNFLLRGEETISASTLLDRLLDAISQWRDFASLHKELHEKLIKSVLCNDNLKQTLTETSHRIERIAISEFLEMCENHQIAMSEDMLLYVLCLNYIEGVYMEISLHLMLKLTSEDYLHPEAILPISPMTDTPSEFDFS